jgi:dTDP-4-amino-4,6-dideoxygalactose transaminase
MFVKYRGGSVGSWGDIGCFSMYVAHLLTAGVGGISTTNNPDYAVKMRSLVNHGRDGIYISIDDDDGLENSELQEVIERRFNFESIGHSYRITELEAALALAQLDDWDQMIATRQRNAAYLTSYLEHLGDKLQLPACRPQAGHAFMMYPIVVREGSKWALCQHLERNGIETREMLRLSDQPAYVGLWNPDDYPVAKWLNEGGVYVGVHQDLTVEDMAYIAEVIGDFFGR